MHTHDLSPWRHAHEFDAGHAAGERGTRQVLWITAVTMVVEIATGWLTESMALLADGFHMSSHALAIGLSAFAYAAARRLAKDPRYSFGTWKIEVLAGFASAILLLAVIALMVVGSVERLLQPRAILYPEALAVAVLGLVVNLVSALILGSAHRGHGHGHHDHHGHDHHGQHHHDHHEHAGHAARHVDLNLKSAYVHVLTDALTSLLAIAALLGGWYAGWDWLDPVMGLVGAFVVALWARRLLADTAKVLLDREMDAPVVAEIREAVAEHGAAGETQIADLHVWRVGRAAYACAMSVVTHDQDLTPDRVRSWLAPHEELVHTTVEIHRCPAG